MRKIVSIHNPVTYDTIVDVNEPVHIGCIPPPHSVCFVFFFTYFFITDVDECATQENCAHGCHNTLGSYACVCNAAYELGSDGKQCYSPFHVLILSLHP